MDTRDIFVCRTCGTENKDNRSYSVFSLRCSWCGRVLVGALSSGANQAVAGPLGIGLRKDL